MSTYVLPQYVAKRHQLIVNKGRAGPQTGLLCRFSGPSENNNGRPVRVPARTFFTTRCLFAAHIDVHNLLEEHARLQTDSRATDPTNKIKKLTVREPFVDNGLAIQGCSGGNDSGPMGPDFMSCGPGAVVKEPHKSY